MIRIMTYHSKTFRTQRSFSSHDVYKDAIDIPIFNAYSLRKMEWIYHIRTWSWPLPPLYVIKNAIKIIPFKLRSEFSLDVYGIMHEVCVFCDYVCNCTHSLCICITSSVISIVWISFVSLSLDVYVRVFTIVFNCMFVSIWQVSL